MGFVGRIVGNSISTAVGVTAATYATRGIDNAYQNHQANRAMTQKEVMDVLLQYYEGQNMLPGDARAKASTVYAQAHQRMISKGFTQSNPTGEAVVNGWADYCRGLMELERVTVADFRDWWDTDALIRECLLIWADEGFHVCLDGARQAGLDEDSAVRYAWKHTPVFAEQGAMPGRDADYSPLPAELWTRVNNFRNSYAHPFDTADVAPEALAGPTLNGYLRQQALAGAL